MTLARDAGAYYNYASTEMDGKLYNRWDFGLTGGISYFINKGFYFGLKYDFGLMDITNNKMDFLRKKQTKLRAKVLSNHFDRNVGFQASFGFRF
ncbi:MAG: hypothetical protein IPJ13_10625 [Saprospiraceae bacterium]|nr:hypothetical protein [Saprospiraceae bacterium]